MKRKNWYWVGGVALGILIIGGGLVIAIKHEPNFYRQGQVPPGEHRAKLASQFLNNFSQMMIYVLHRSEPHWGCVATDAEINCFFQEAFRQRGEAESLRKLGISEPSVTLEGDHMRMAFRYSKGWFSTIVSYDLRIWLVAKEPNVVAVQVLSARAGAVPISCQSVLHQLSEFATKQNFKVSFYRYEGTPVAIISLQPDQPNPNSILTRLEVNGNTFIIQGRTLEHALPPPSIGKVLPQSPTP